MRGSFFYGVKKKWKLFSINLQKGIVFFFTSFMNLLYFPKEIVLVIMELFTDFNCKYI